MVSIEEITLHILDIVADCYEAYDIARQEPEEFESFVMGALLHWHAIVNLILESEHPNISDLHSLNDMLSCLNLTAEEYEQVFADQLADLYNACYNYQPFEPYLNDEFGTTLNDYLEQVQGQGEDEDENEDENMPNQHYMAVG